jgi:hypothetical protein
MRRSVFLNEYTNSCQMVDFDKAFQLKDDNRLEEMWAIISAVGLWANVEDVSKMIGK